jgi:hypothetical protein
MKKEKSRKKVFHMGKKTAKCSLVILSALVIHTAPTVIQLPMGDTHKKCKKGQNHCTLLYSRTIGTQYVRLQNGDAAKERGE